MGFTTVTTGYQVDSTNDLILIPESDRFDGMMRFIKVSSPIKRQWWSFISSSTAIGNSYSNNPRVLIPADTPSQNEILGSGRWHQTTSRPIATDDYSSLSAIDPNDFDEGDLAYANGQYGGLFAYHRNRAIPALAGVVVIVGSTDDRWIRVAPASFPRSTRPSTYNSGQPPAAGLIWVYTVYITEGSSLARTVPFLSTENSWIAIASPLFGDADPYFIPDFVGQQFLNNTDHKLWIASGTSSYSDWKLHSTGVDRQ